MTGEIWRKVAPAVYLAIGLAAFGLASGEAWAGGDWNDGKISWRPYEQGLAEARRTGKPVCLIFYTEWCPHCANYSRVFHDPAVVAMAERFVMIRIDKDRHPELSRKYAPDGEYIPRTFFLSPDGKLETSLHAPRERFLYFYDERDPASVLAGMKAALARFAAR